MDLMRKLLTGVTKKSYGDSKLHSSSLYLVNNGVCGLKERIKTWTCLLNSPKLVEISWIHWKQFQVGEYQRKRNNKI
jgi:hypothetical protein